MSGPARSSSLAASRLASAAMIGASASCPHTDTVFSSVRASAAHSRRSLQAAAARVREIPGRTESATESRRSIDVLPAPRPRVQPEGAVRPAAAAATVPDPSVLIIRRIVLARNGPAYGPRRGLQIAAKIVTAVVDSPLTFVVRALLRTCAREAGILNVHPMTRRLMTFSVVMLLTAPIAARAADARSESKEEVEFGIKVAQSGLWNEALYRWQKAVALDPTYAAAWNNLAIAYEHEGKFEDAKKAYEKALQLDPKNLMIRQNYDLFKEINDRTKRRQGK